MYRVNIDKLVNVDSDKKKDFEHIAEDITGNLNLHKSVAVIGGRVDTFRIAYGIMEKGNKVLFIDGDIKRDVFLGKYKLGKNAKGVIDYLKNPNKNHEIICVTNHKGLDIIFTGINDDEIVTRDERDVFKNLLEKYSNDYDYIVVDTDEDGLLAQYCDKTMIIKDEEAYSVEDMNEDVNRLEADGCSILGVVIRE